MLETVIMKNKEKIKKETLTIDLIVREKMEHGVDCNINGEKLNIDVELAN